MPKCSCISERKIFIVCKYSQCARTVTKTNIDTAKALLQLPGATHLDPCEYFALFLFRFPFYSFFILIFLGLCLYYGVRIPVIYFV